MVNSPDPSAKTQKWGIRKFQATNIFTNLKPMSRNHTTKPTLT